MKITAEPRSDQWNADDLTAGPRTFTIAGVRAGTAEQKYDILFEGHERVWRPPLTVLRILLAAWGDDATTWVGRAVTLYKDPDIRFGRDLVGGIRVSELTDLPDDKPLTTNLQTSRGHRSAFTVQPMSRRDAYTLEWKSADPARRLEIEAAVATLTQDSTS